jgi:hypothetical protein
MRLWLLSLLAACPLFLSAILACSIPSQEDVDEAVMHATDDCREIVQAEIPGLVTQVAIAAAVVCGQIGDEARDAILLYLGCIEEEGGGWDCQGARARACWMEP